MAILDQPPVFFIIAPSIIQPELQPYLQPLVDAFSNKICKNGKQE
jgi:hypothetical protein